MVTTTVRRFLRKDENKSTFVPLGSVAWEDVVKDEENILFAGLLLFVVRIGLSKNVSVSSL